jgi:hypothetical protein
MNPADFSDETIGDDLLPLLNADQGEAVVAALAGCAWYRDDPDDLWTIVECDRGKLRLVVRRGDATRLVALAGGYVLHGPAQRAIFEAALSPTVRLFRQDAATIAAFGYPGRVDHDDLGLLAEAIRQAKDGPMPSSVARAAVLALAGKYQPERMVERFCTTWLAHCEGPPPGDVLIALVTALRHSGRTAEALARTDVLLQNEHGLTDGEQAVLCTQRAALWLDRFEQTADAKMLDRAERSAARAWRIAPSDHCSLVYQRLERLRGEHADELGDAHATQRAAKLDAAHREWRGRR